MPAFLASGGYLGFTFVSRRSAILSGGNEAGGDDLSEAAAATSKRSITIVEAAATPSAIHATKAVHRRIRPVGFLVSVSFISLLSRVLASKTPIACGTLSGFPCSSMDASRKRD